MGPAHGSVKAVEEIERRRPRAYPVGMGTAALADTESGERRRWSHTLRKFLGLSLDLALPPLCPACREPVGAQGALCASCWSKLSFIAPPYCERLGTPFGHALLADANGLIPVPLHWRRLWARRFNQSAALANIVSQASGVPVVDDALKRVKATLQQVGLSASERAINVQGAFAVVDRSRIAGRRLILIDDVLTSGATIDACARALNRAGAATVDVVVLARVVDAGRSPI
jgi:predicted amidophosphoribosyltransferase